ncbi:MAG: BrnT family toxin, partial [Gammaproteobacteria bacterium]|nr:BrnT family toxin [Gammaproteobacteria bacterium]
MVQYDFEWDTEKARGNRRKHHVSFEQGSTVFQDPRAASLYDQKHSETEDRWVTLGISSNSGL